MKRDAIDEKEDWGKETRRRKENGKKRRLESEVKRKKRIGTIGKEVGRSRSGRRDVPYVKFSENTYSYSYQMKLKNSDAK